MSKNAIQNMNDKSDSAETVKVVIRCRPLSKNEMAQGHEVVVNVPKGRGEIFVDKPDANEAPKQFTFDHCYDWTAKQSEIY